MDYNLLFSRPGGGNRSDTPSFPGNRCDNHFDKEKPLSRAQEENLKTMMVFDRTSSKLPTTKIFSTTKVFNLGCIRIIKEGYKFGFLE